MKIFVCVPVICYTPRPITSPSNKRRVRLYSLCSICFKDLTYSGTLQMHFRGVEALNTTRGMFTVISDYEQSNTSRQSETCTPFQTGVKPKIPHAESPNNFQQINIVLHNQSTYQTTSDYYLATRIKHVLF